MIVTESEFKAPSEEQITTEKKRLGRLLGRYRKGCITVSGQPFSTRAVSEATGLSPTSISAAERGTVSLNTLLTLMMYYGKTTGLKLSDLFEDMGESYVPVKVLRKYAESVDLTTKEFLSAVQHFPLETFKVSYRAYNELLSLGFATAYVEKKKGVIEYYATTSEKAESDETSGLNWNIASDLLATPFTQLGDEMAEFYKVMQTAAIDAIRKYQNGETDD